MKLAPVLHLPEQLLPDVCRSYLILLPSLRVAHRAFDPFGAARPTNGSQFPTNGSQQLANGSVKLSEWRLVKSGCHFAERKVCQITPADALVGACRSSISPGLAGPFFRFGSLHVTFPRPSTS
jgi:hypothetical protein